MYFVENERRKLSLGQIALYIDYFRCMILVTGGTGLVGAHLLRRLVERGDQVRATYRSESSKQKTQKIFGYTHDNPEELMNRVEWVKTDLFDIIDPDEAMIGIETVFHCAAVVSFQPSDNHLVLEGNPEMTRLLINSALANGVKNFIHTSSVAAIGRAKEGEVTTEDTEWKDSPLNSVYSKSKFASEMEVWRGSEEGLNVGFVNPAIILGPGNWESGSSKLFHTFYKGFRFYTAGQTGFVDVEDVVEAMLRVLEKEAFGNRFILSSENVKYKQLFDWITNCYDVKSPDILPPRWVMELLWRIEWLRSKLTKSTPLVTKETARTARSQTRFDNTKAREELGIEFMPVKASVEKNCKLYLKDRS